MSEKLEQFNKVTQTISEINERSEGLEILAIVSAGAQKAILLKGHPIDMMATLCSAMEHDIKFRSFICTAVDAFRKGMSEKNNSTDQKTPANVN